MDNLVFARTRTPYKTYEDFWRLVELSKFDTCYVDEIDASDADKTYIITPMNGEWKHGWPDAQARIIYWNLEWGKPDDVPGLAEVWTSDRYHAEKTGARFVPLGSHPALVHVQIAARWIDPQWDVALLAYMEPYRRAKALHQMKDAGLNIAPNGWDDERLCVLERARCMVNVHQLDEWPCLPVQRFALAAAAGIPLISEDCVDPYPFRPGEDFVSAPRDELASVARNMLSNGQGRNLVASMWQRACVEFRFDVNVRAALEEAQ